MLEQRRLMAVVVGQYCDAQGNISSDISSWTSIVPEGEAGGTEDLAPESEDDSVKVNFAETAVVIPSQMLGNDRDPEGLPLSIVGISNISGGTAELRQGLVFFTPDDSLLPMSFDYVVRNPAGLDSTATVRLTARSPVHGMHDDHVRAAEHQALFTLIDSNDTTNVAVQAGLWSDAETWSTGVVPGEGDRVLIHNTVEVVYDVHSDAALEWLRVDGVLTFRPDVNTQLVVETLATDPLSILNIGTQDESVHSDVTAQILIDTSGGPLSQVEDPTLIGRGVISHGQTNIYGAEKVEHTTLLGDALAGDAYIELADATSPVGWQVGDTLLLVGTEVDASLLGLGADADAIVAADADNSRFGDELLEITSFDVVDGRVRVFFNNVTNQSAMDQGLITLLWKHERPDGDTFDASELSIHVANLTRNVVVRSSDPSVDTQERGHFMLMHNTNAEVHHAQFRDLGRSDKRLVVDDPIAVGNFDGTPGTGTNTRGRYGLHLHRMGANDLNGNAAQITGNVVWGTPGWGIVQHDSHAVLENNVVFDVVGAGIVAEEGNELGVWRDNLVVKITGDLVNNFDDNVLFKTLRGPRFDLGFVGSGYWVQGGGFGIRLEDNVAASTNGAGFDLVHNTDGLAKKSLVSVENIADPLVRQAFIDAGHTVITPNNVPTRGIDGLVSYNGFRGIHTWLHNRDSQDMEGVFTFGTWTAHDFRSTIENYQIWNVQSGVQNFYSTRFDFLNGLIVGDLDNPVHMEWASQANNASGIGVSHNQGDANNILFDGLRIEGFEYGFQVFSPHYSEITGLVPYATSELRNAAISNVEYAFLHNSSQRADRVTDQFSDLFVLDESSTFNTLTAEENVAPIAAFEFTNGEGISVVLDAANSRDLDPGPRVIDTDDGIAAYAWDLDGDGQYDDAYGQSLIHNFAAVGEYSIGLKVWDDDGANSTITQLVTATANPYSNPWLDGDFSATDAFSGGFYGLASNRRGEGWIARDMQRNPAGFAEIATPQHQLGRLGQVVRNQYVHRGQQTFSFDIMNTNVDYRTNHLQVSLFGINGQWDLANFAPSPIYAMAAPEFTALVDVDMGPTDSADWQTQTFDIDLGAEGFEYLVIVVEYLYYNYEQGDYFALDNFSLTSDFAMSVPLPALSLSGNTHAFDNDEEPIPLQTPRDVLAFATPIVGPEQPAPAELLPMPRGHLEDIYFSESDTEEHLPFLEL
ncbi:G8 domain protein [Roseimaritima multifibrata]|uniref:G8 domain protein n=1 Tax=Roseimaritima multifibrata TaxID=1930274 RepID=A0A517MMJ5_9BACT|nr:G8 domain-containing protein [Roseimaritima multifibrata]QDS96104.1 G8 domain protein [Roseimaritima multifibrata]